MILYNRSVILLLSLFLLLLQGSTFIIDPSNNAVLHNNLGLSQLKEGYYFAAIEEFKIAIKLCPNTSLTGNFYNNLGLAYQKIYRYDWALSCFQKAISLNPNFIEYYFNLVKTFKLKGSLIQAENKYKKMTQGNNTNSKIWLILGLIYKEQNKNEQAINCFKEFKKLEPDLIISQSIEGLINNLK